MKTFPFIILFSFLLAYSAQTHSPTQKIDTLFAHVTDQTPGYMVGIMHQDQFIWKEGYGLANLEHQIPIQSTTAFNIASLSKQFTAAAIALLILEGKLTLEEEVATYFPDFPFSKSGMQIKHLVYMTSGINDYYYNERENGMDWSSLQFFNIDDAIAASFSSNELMYAPGEKWSYSNINYMLLTKIVEQVSGQSFADFVEKRIFQPLEMHHSFVNDDVFQVIPNRAMGYNYRDKENTEWMIEGAYLPSNRTEGFLQIHRNSPHYGGSGIYTTMDDFQKWLANFHTKKLGGQAFYDLMHQTMKFEHDKENDAFGLVFGDFNGHEMVWYEGGDWGFSAYMMRFPKSGYSVVCFSNLGTGNARKYTHQVMEVLLEEEVVKLH